jgi:hypothetical protein
MPIAIGFDRIDGSLSYNYLPLGMKEFQGIKDANVL